MKSSHKKRVAQIGSDQNKCVCQKRLNVTSKDLLRRTAHYGTLRFSYQSYKNGLYQEQPRISSAAATVTHKDKIFYNKMLVNKPFIPTKLST